MGEATAEKDFYWKLFKSTFIISAFTIGGGFVIIPLLKAKFVDEYKWMDDKDFFLYTSDAADELRGGGPWGWRIC